MSRKIIARLASRAARAYIAGPELDDAFRICGRLAESGYKCTIGYWNGDEPHQEVARQYLLALATDALRQMNCYLSVKAPAVGFELGILRDVARTAGRSGTPVHFDSLGPESADATLRTIEKLLPDYRRLGCTLPGRWRRSLSDADLTVQLGIRVRVVKGQWPDNGAPDCDPASGFVAIVKRLAGRARHVGVATHDTIVARQAIEMLTSAGTPCELELLWGLPYAESARLARGLRVPVTFYVPYGYAWLPYALSQGLHHPQVLFWFLRDLLSRRYMPRPLRPAVLDVSAPARPGGT